MATLLDGFEATPLVSLKTWTKDLTNSALGIGTVVNTVSRTTSNVTQGTYTWRNQGTVGTDFPGLCTTTTTDLSSYTDVSLDVFIASVQPDTQIFFIISDGTTPAFIDTPAGSTGAFTLTINIADAITAGVNVNSAYICYVAFDPMNTGAVDYYVDNLRGETAPSGITGTLTATQANNTISSTSKLAIKGTLTGTQAGNTLSSTGKVAIKGTLTQTQAGNTVSSTGKLALKATLTATQASNTISSTGKLAITASAILTQEDNTLSATGTVGSTGIVGDLTVIQDGNSVSSTGSISITGDLSATQSDNTLSSVGSVGITGNFSAIQADNTLIGTGHISPVETTVLDGGVPEEDYRRYRRKLEKLVKASERFNQLKYVSEAVAVAEIVKDIPIETPIINEVAQAVIDDVIPEIDFTILQRELNQILQYMNAMINQRILAEHQLDDELALLLMV